jgi:alpha-L-arabinofuranosidase
MNRITVTSEPLYAEAISPFIYGDFVEFVNDLIPGMWAEKVRDRCFEGLLQPRMLHKEEDWTRPCWEPFASGSTSFRTWPDRPVDFEISLPEVRFTLDKERPYVGTRSARVGVGTAPGRPVLGGIIQHGISVRRDQDLRFTVALRVREPERTIVHALLGRQYGAFFREYARLSFADVGGEWELRQGIMRSAADDDAASLVLCVDASGGFWADKVSLMPTDAPGGWRLDVVEAVRNLKPGIIRFGGSTLLHYQWQQNVGPRERRAPFENHPWGNLEENDVGLFEFLELCRLVGAEPLVCLNAKSSSIAQILEEIEYCNGPAESRWGAVRAAQGSLRPFGVRYWQIGNEQQGEDYERTLKEYARAIRGAYPDLILLASYPSDRIIDELSADIDYVCPHLYTPYTPAMESELRRLADRARGSAGNPKLRIAVTEWNHTAGSWGPARAWLLTHCNALNAARMLNMYQRLGDVVRIANRSNLVNSSCSGIIQTGPSDLYLTPTYHVQSAYSRLSGDQALAVRSEAGEGLDVSATRRGREVILAVVNCQNEPQRRRIELPDAPTGAATAWSLAAPCLDAVNSLQEKDRVAPREVEMKPRGNALDYEFPGYSVTILRFS